MDLPENGEIMYGSRSTIEKVQNESLKELFVLLKRVP